jgi:hypothetical protein
LAPPESTANTVSDRCQSANCALLTQIDARQAVLECNLLRANVFLDGDGIIGAALHCRVVGHDHHFLPVTLSSVTCLSRAAHLPGQQSLTPARDPCLSQCHQRAPLRRTSCSPRAARTPRRVSPGRAARQCDRAPTTCCEPRASCAQFPRHLISTCVRSIFSSHTSCEC